MSDNIESAGVAARQRFKIEQPGSVQQRIGAWIRGPLRDWAESLLTPTRLAAGGLLRPEPVQQAWREHLAGTRNWQYPLWTVLMLQAWRERWG